MDPLDAHDAYLATLGRPPLDRAARVIVRDPVPAADPAPPATPGPGTVLKGWLAEPPPWLATLPRRFAGRSTWLPARAGCGCEDDAAAMDRAGPAGVLADLDAWADRLKAKPEAANIPRWIVRRAIEAACAKAARRGSE